MAKLSDTMGVHSGSAGFTLEGDSCGLRTLTLWDAAGPSPKASTTFVETSRRALPGLESASDSAGTSTEIMLETHLIQGVAASCAGDPIWLIGAVFRIISAPTVLEPVKAEAFVPIGVIGDPINAGPVW